MSENQPDTLTEQIETINKKPSYTIVTTEKNRYQVPYDVFFPNDAERFIHGTLILHMAYNEVSVGHIDHFEAQLPEKNICS